MWDAQVQGFLGSANGNVTYLDPHDHKTSPPAQDNVNVIATLD